MQIILDAVELLADIIIEKEGAFGMKFGELEFEARWKADNPVAYCRNRNFSLWNKTSGLPTPSDTEIGNALSEMREYFRDKLEVKDEVELGKDRSSGEN
jgi:hypothetical protein